MPVTNSKSEKKKSLSTTATVVIVIVLTLILFAIFYFTPLIDYIFMGILTIIVMLLPASSR